MSTVQGACSERFEPLRAEFARRVRSGDEPGASIAVDVDGESVVDLWGGSAAADGSAPWEPDTLVPVWSCTKAVTTVAVLLLVDRGELGLDAPVARYWPEFASRDKQSVTVEQLLSHTAGLPGWEPALTADEVYHWETASGRLAEQAPWWPPGTASGYHMQTFGQLLGELVRRVDGRSLRDLVFDEITVPWAVDVHIGADRVDGGRIAEMIPPTTPPIDVATLPPDGITLRALTSSPLTPVDANTEAWRAADLGAVNGHANARSLARLLSVVSRDGLLDDRRVLSAPTVSRVADARSDGVDLVLGIPVRWGLGFALGGGGTLPWIPRDDGVCFWGGYGGSMVVVDRRNRTTITYAMNRQSGEMLGSERAAAYVRAAFAALDG